MSDTDLREYLLRAAAGRIGKPLLSPAGLYTVRVFAAVLMERDTDDDGLPIEPLEGLVRVLNAIRQRIGNRDGERLNSYALIGRRLVAEAYMGGCAESFYIEDGRPMFRVVEDV